MCAPAFPAPSGAPMLCSLQNTTEPGYGLMSSLKLLPGCGTGPLSAEAANSPMIRVASHPMVLMIGSWLRRRPEDQRDADRSHGDSTVVGTFSGEACPD